MFVCVVWDALNYGRMADFVLFKVMVVVLVVAVFMKEKKMKGSPVT